jgi:hypothetical protein
MAECASFALFLGILGFAHSERQGHGHGESYQQYSLN